MPGAARHFRELGLSHEARRLDLETVNLNRRARPRVIVFAAVILVKLSDCRIESCLLYTSKRSYLSHYRHLRLERSRELLRQSSATITDIAVACGFSSASHFTRAYRETYDTTPSSDPVSYTHLKDAKVLAFKPDWKKATAKPVPQYHDPAKIGY